MTNTSTSPRPLTRPERARWWAFSVLATVLVAGLLGALVAPLLGGNRGAGLLVGVALGKPLVALYGHWRLRTPVGRAWVFDTVLWLVCVALTAWILSYA